MAEEEPYEMLSGSCHCGRVSFRCRVPVSQPILECNCSICTKKGFLHLIVKKEDFFLDTPAEGEAGLTEYQFNTKTARHLFCPVCGVQSFYRPRSHPEGFSVNARCLVEAPTKRTIRPFDGRNWEQNLERIR